jgi:putative membrane protein insertion efficiency factor
LASWPKPKDLAKNGLVKVIEAYQVISRFTPAACRFTPTCSEYGKQAVLKYGCIKGSWMATRRICRCHPFHVGGYDPVP